MSNQFSLSKAHHSCVCACVYYIFTCVSFKCVSGESASVIVKWGMLFWTFDSFKV